MPKVNAYLLFVQGYRVALCAICTSLAAWLVKKLFLDETVQ